jgi:hypothetical protein
MEEKTKKCVEAGAKNKISYEIKYEKYKSSFSLKKPTQPFLL